MSSNLDLLLDAVCIDRAMFSASLSASCATHFPSCAPKMPTYIPAPAVSNEKLDLINKLRNNNVIIDINVPAETEETIQKMTDNFIKKIEEHLVQKEAEIMKV